MYSDLDSKQSILGIAPKFYRCVSMNGTDEYTEFCVTALSEGTGDMGFLCIKNDGSKENYVLYLSFLYRNRCMQIDALEFVEEYLDMFESRSSYCSELDIFEVFTI